MLTEIIPSSTVEPTISAITTSQTTPPQPAFEMTPSMLAIPMRRGRRTAPHVDTPSLTHRHPLNLQVVVGLQAPPVGPSTQELTCPNCLQPVRTLVAYEQAHGRICMSICALLCIGFSI
ncbi:uncharacterized protein LOC110118620 [Ceratitis capitata]|uniref:uncharacterized protein LOC110118620 n=1 Tax=Ceratitis capitata TaxID=7213 RepID=UPI000A119825|nr:uncharacterized protein LOC110118620 [Ceratitis capitata]